jgi:hypothetical protein
MTNWMRLLAQHFDRMRFAYPDDDLVVVFDIDGTIVDLRFLTQDVLRWYDQAHGTDHFRGLDPAELGFHGAQLPEFLRLRGLSSPEQQRVLDWYAEKSWTEHAFLASHRPFRGVLEVIRWLQLQESMSVALNTGRSESMRTATLQSLNALGREFRVSFRDELLIMSPTGDEDAIAQGKADGIELLRAAGYRVIAMVDNEPANLQAVAMVDQAEEILLLHADTVFVSHRETSPRRTISGTDYEVSQLMDDRLPRHIQFVWQALSDRDRLERFLASNVYWGELDVRRDPVTGDLIVRRDDLGSTPLAAREELLQLEEALMLLREHDKGVKLHVCEGGSTLFDLVSEVQRLGPGAEQLWFGGRVDVLGATGFALLADRFPSSLREAQAEFLAPLALAEPFIGLQMVAMLQVWGIGRVSLSWTVGRKAELVEYLLDAGMGIDLRDLPDGGALLSAVLLGPDSITADLQRPPVFLPARV